MHDARYQLVQYCRAAVQQQQRDSRKQTVMLFQSDQGDSADRLVQAFEQHSIRDLLDQRLALAGKQHCLSYRIMRKLYMKTLENFVQFK